MKDAGSAFPLSEYTMDQREGISLRDYLAAHAMGPVHDFRPRSFAQWLKWFCGFDYKSPIANHQDIAREAYLRADAMLAEREKE